MLSDFLAEHRDELLDRARLRVAARSPGPASKLELVFGLPVFFDQLQRIVRSAVAAQRVDHAELVASARDHGQQLFHRGLTVAQVVEDYGDLCQVITGLTIELDAPISVREFQALNLCLDAAIAGAVSAYGLLRERALTAEGAERMGVLAHEMRNLLNTALLAFAGIKAGTVPINGSTGAILERSLTGLHTLIDRSFAAVRLDAGVGATKPISMRDVMEEVVIGASLVAHSKGIPLLVQPVDEGVLVVADLPILAAAITNLLQNAFKFTKPATLVTLTAHATDSRVLVQVEDHCGGLPPGTEESLLRPFVQRGDDRSGLGLGLSICAKAMESMHGALHVKDVPGKGCVFTLDIPRYHQAP